MASGWCRRFRARFQDGIRWTMKEKRLEGEGILPDVPEGFALFVLLG